VLQTLPKPSTAIHAVSASLASTYRRWCWYAVAFAIAAAIAAYATVPFVLGPKVVGARASRHDVVQTVVATGHVETPYRIEIGTLITGTVTRIPVDEGQFVHAGDVLIELDDSETKAAVVQAQGIVAQSEARMRQLGELTLPSAQEALKQAQANLVNAKQSYDRTETLAKNGNATRAALDDAQKTLDVAQAQLRAAEFLVHTVSPGGSDYVMAETQLAQAKAALDVAIARLGYTRVTASTDGTLLTRDVERGNVVQPGKVLMTLSPVGETWLVLQIDEKSFGLLALGQKAVASADSFPARMFPAEVVYINPSVDATRGSVLVKLRVPNPPTYLIQDMTVSVDIEVARRADALILPAEAIHDALSSAPWVLVVESGRTRKQPVQLGARGGGQVEVLDGLKNGDVVVSGTMQIVAGQRVRVQIP
jgi:HlyD family secretion protein